MTKDKNYMAAKGDDQLSIKWRFDFGEGKSSNIQSALVRPFRLCLMEGTPPGKVVLLFYKDSEKYYILGSLCWTPGSRLLFFPTGDLGELMSHNGKDYKNSGFFIDHITLEKNLEDIHISPKDKKASGFKLSNGKTLKINDQSKLWFTLQARSLKDFEKTSSIHEVVINDSYKEIERKAREIRDSQKDSGKLITYVNDSIADSYFINFEFFICLNGDRIDQLSPFIAKPEFPTADLGVRPSTTFTVPIPSFHGTVELRISKVPGRNDTPWRIHMGNDFRI